MPSGSNSKTILTWYDEQIVDLESLIVTTRNEYLRRRNSFFCRPDGAREGGGVRSTQGDGFASALGYCNFCSSGARRCRKPISSAKEM